MNKKLFNQIQKELELNSDKEYRIHIQDYFKMDVSNYLGVRIPLVRKMADKYFKELKGLDIDIILKFCDHLLETKIYEHKVIAFHWSFKSKKQFQEKHFRVFERWLKKYVDDWSDCDDLCTHSLGCLVHKYPKLVTSVKKWSHSKSRWVKRASAVTLIYSVRKGECLNDVFEVATNLLIDEDDLVQKGYGWMLKEASKSYEQEVHEFVMSNKSKMPRTALRYSIEKMSVNNKKAVMQK